ncbi:survival motor neuron protein [Elysia marginata]|uniref:Survival motor neuron protein n=1 Tax=Elysia marginata TaxID=1093978 RepID=A0AAV4GU66_9GAST|nr:survival motor neuron protein [Elysia marginata]
MAAAGAEQDYVLYERGESDESDAWDDSVLIKAYDDAVSAMKARIAEQHPEFSPKPVSVNVSKSKKKKKGKGKQRKKMKNSQSTFAKWSCGDKCQAIYTEDGEVYDAKIMTIDEENGTCLVEYDGYGNREEQQLSNLLPVVAPPSSQDQLTDTASEAESMGSRPSARENISTKQKNKSTSNSSNKRRQQNSWPWFGASAFPPPPPPPFGSMPPPPPPPPPNFSMFQAPGYQASGPSMPMPPIFPSIPPPPPWFTEKGSGDENEALYSMLISWYMSGYHTGYYQGLKHASAGHGAQR